jgi:hypothetical protein
VSEPTPARPRGDGQNRIYVDGDRLRVDGLGAASIDVPILAVEDILTGDSADPMVCHIHLRIAIDVGGAFIADVRRASRAVREHATPIDGAPTPGPIPDRAVPETTTEGPAPRSRVPIAGPALEPDSDEWMAFAPLPDTWALSRGELLSTTDADPS